MRISVHSICLFALLVGVGAVPPSVCSETASGHHLQLQLSPAQPTLMPAEPLLLVATLSNHTDSTERRFTEVVHGLDVSYEGGAFTRLLMPAMRNFIHWWRAPSLRPQESVTKTYFALSPRPSTDDRLIKPGTYAIRATSVVQDVSTKEFLTLKSNTVTVRVMPLQGVDREAFRLFAGDAQVPLVLGVTISRDAAAELERLVSVYPDSTYAKYALYFLALRNIGPDDDVPTDYDRALAMFSRVVSDYDPFSLTPEAMYQIADIHSGKLVPAYGQTRLWLQRIVDEFPDSHLKDRALRRIANLPAGEAE